jgi:hypothetical protein
MVTKMVYGHLACESHHRYETSLRKSRPLQRPNQLTDSIGNTFVSPWPERAICLSLEVLYGLLRNVPFH